MFGLIMAATTLFSAIKARKDAKKSREQQAEIAEEQQQLARDEKSQSDLAYRDERKKRASARRGSGTGTPVGLAASLFSPRSFFAV